jgi:hypothetical protein
MSRHRHTEFSLILFVLRLILQVAILTILLTILTIYKFFDFFIGARYYYPYPLEPKTTPPKTIISYIDAPAVCTALTLAAVGYMVYSGYFDEDIRGLSLRVVNSITHPGKY